MKIKLKKFKDLISKEGVFSDGNWIESKDQNPDGSVRLIQLADIGVGKFIDKSNRFMTEERANDLNCTYLVEGDILVARMPDPIGRACIFPQVQQKCVTVVDICIIRPASDQIDTRWLMHLINSKHFNNQVLQYVTGTTRQRISRGNLAKLDVEVPPLDEQKRIAAILDKADAIRRKRQQAIKLADDFLRSVFLDMFGDPVTNPKGWELKPLAFLCRKITDGTHHSPPIVEKGVPYVTAKHLKKTGLEFHAKPWYVSEEEHKKIFSRCNPEKDDVLYIKDGATTGLAAINEYDFEFSMLSSLALLKPNFELVNSEFLCMFLNHPRTKLVLTANMAGAAITRLTLAKIKDVQVPLPDINTQEKFKEVYLSVRALSNKVKASDGLSEQEFNSLSQKAFAGEL
ncbi:MULTISPECIES: restriction endonuclease subunit S [unclassified Pseudoalteromonas]|uniref:restriction endonuclease subunit S n=1 Tax=unclassified Pseudoalteromonas TaxID=194690 RepID=UPI00331817E4